MSEKLEIFAKELDLSNDLRDYIQKKTNKLSKFLQTIDELRVDLAYSKSARNADDRYVAQITLRGKGFILRAEERADDIKPAIDLVVDKIRRQIERYKGKRFLNRSDIRPAGEIFAEKISEDASVEVKTNIARRKTFTLYPMDEYEAIEQMNLLGHEDFFIFYNANNEKINVLYKRRDGSYGLIEPEIAQAKLAYKFAIISPVLKSTE